MAVRAAIVGVNVVWLIRGFVRRSRMRRLGCHSSKSPEASDQLWLQRLVPKIADAYISNTSANGLSFECTSTRSHQFANYWRFCRGRNCPAPLGQPRLKNQNAPYRVFQIAFCAEMCLPQQPDGTGVKKSFPLQAVFHQQFFCPFAQWAA